MYLLLQVEFIHIKLQNSMTAITLLTLWILKKVKNRKNQN
jgi:hypothetical protein